MSGISKRQSLDMERYAKRLGGDLNLEFYVGWQ
jgi:hypothetical protein